MLPARTSAVPAATSAHASHRSRRRAAWGPYGRYPLLVLALVGFVEALERRVLPGVLGLVQDDLGFSDLQAGLLDTALIVAALLVAVPAGVLADRLDRRRFIAAAFATWAVVSAAMAAVRGFGQLFALRAVLGAGDAVNDPAAQSLIADYYPPTVRGRAYGVQRVTPTLGAGLGLGLGAALGAVLGWRVAVASMALPGLAVTLLVWRLREPVRGGSEPDPPAPPALVRLQQHQRALQTSARTYKGEVPEQRGGEPRTRAAPALSSLPARDRVRCVLRIRSLRALMLATAVTSGVLSAVAFWGVVYHQRANGLDLATAGAVAGAPVLVGALVGSLGGGWLVDHLRTRIRGAPMVVAAVMSGAGAVVFTVGFLDGLPLYAVRVPLHALAVGLLVGSLPATTAMAAEVVPARLRGTTFGLLKLSANLLAAVMPPVVGAIADAHQVLTADGEHAGDIALGFRLTIPFILVASVLLLRGQRWVDSDVVAARTDDG